MSDTITFLHSRGPRLAKFIQANGEITAYDEARTYFGAQHELLGLGDLRDALTWLLSKPHVCVVRGALIDPNRTTPIRRLLYRDPATGGEPTLREAPRRWLATDWDALERGRDLDATDLPGCAHEALARLPAAFHGAACIVQATGSHGLKPGIRIRLWHWLSRPLTGAELGRWLGNVIGIDRSVFRPAQIIYTAAPVFETGQDHLPRRLAFIPGSLTVEPPSTKALAPPPPKPMAPLPKPSDARADRYAWAALRNAAARIAVSGEGNRHPSIVREARSLARFIEGGLLTRQVVAQTLEQAAAAAGKPEGEASKVMEWAIDHPSAGELRIAV